MIIRRATATDADLLTALAHKIFLDTFGAQNTQKDIDIHVERTYGHDIQMRELTDPALTYLIAEVDGKAAGFAMIGEAKSESCMAHDAPIELFRFYVDKAWHGKPSNRSGSSGWRIHARSASMRRQGSIQPAPSHIYSATIFRPTG